MNIPLKFNYNINDIKNLQNNIINTHKKWLENIKQNKNITPNEFLDSYLYNLTEFDYTSGILHFLKYVSPNKSIRDLLFNINLEMQKYFLDFFESTENYKLFLILKKIKTKTNNTQKLIKKILKSFEDNCEKLSIINNKLMKYESKFSQNIMNDIKKIKYTKSELEGIDNNILKKHKKGEYYIFDTTYPDETVILKNCSIAKSREKMYNTFNNVAKQNLSILKNIINLRSERSKILGFDNSVSYYLDDNRIATLNKINKLLDRLIPILKKKLNNEYKNLLEVSKMQTLNDYDLAYYSNIYKQTYLDLDEQIIKTYFPSNYTIPKIIQIYADLFNIKIKLIKEIPDKYWHKDVELYVVNDEITNNILGYIYLDLYPRDGKYTHAATFDIQTTYRDENNKRILPVTAIVCNFSNSLFMFNEIVTFCHEFGHALHNVLSDVKYQSLAGISMEEDFGEMPSQFFENWCYNEEFLNLISCHYETKKKLPVDIIDKIQKNRNYNNGIHYLTQILYIKYDLMIHQKKNVTEKYLHNLWFKILSSLLPFKFNKNIHPMCRFDHIIGYASGYYGYLWSIIYAYDAFSLFEEKGIFNKKLGLKFRKTILEKGGTEKGVTMLENFLGRKTNNKKIDGKI